jgi:hypothetical protein
MVLVAAAVERAMKRQEVIMRALSGTLTWLQAADILGMELCCWLLGWPASENGRLCPGAGTHEGGERCRRGLMLPLLPLHAVQVHAAGQQPHAVHDHAHPEERAQQDQVEGAPARDGRCIRDGDILLEAGAAASGSRARRGDWPSWRASARGSRCRPRPPPGSRPRWDSTAAGSPRSRGSGSRRGAG